jgi:hypothetical protein
VNQWRKGIAAWHVGKTLYLSVPFTWLLPEAKVLADAHRGPVVAGGPAVQLMPVDWAEMPATVPYDTLAMHNPLATFTTRGCPNHCEFCAVPKIEGAFVELATWKPAPVVCDNNLLAASNGHFEHVIEGQMQFPYTDFNQGLDARRFTGWHASQIARLPSAKVRFAFDHVRGESALVTAVGLARNAGLSDFGVYVLIGFRDSPEDARYRLERVRSLGILPNPMRYQPLDATQKDSHVAEGWTGRELRRMMRYYSRLVHLGHIRYEDYFPTDATLFDEVELCE